MITLYGAGYRISCDDTTPCPGGHGVSPLTHTHPCGRKLQIDPIGLGEASLEGVLEAARSAGWRAYLLAHRRDLCPTHAAAARRRLTLVPVLKG